VGDASVGDPLASTANYKFVPTRSDSFAICLALPSSPVADVKKALPSSDEE
jgi:hypothetical protein